MIIRNLVFVGFLSALVALSGCCADGDVAPAGENDLAGEDKGEDKKEAGDGPQSSKVMGAVVFSGAGGVQIDLSIVDPELIGATTTGEITVWAGSRDKATGPALPSPTSLPPDEQIIAQASFWNFLRLNGDENRWAPGVVSETYDENHDQFWVFVRLKMNRDGSGEPVKGFYRADWDAPDGGDITMKEILKQ